MSSTSQQHSVGGGLRNIVDRTLDDKWLRTRCPLDNGRHAGEPRYSLGKLDLLPNELFREIFTSLDIPSLTAFRRVNRRAMSAVDSLPEYAAVFKHCPNIIRGIISIKADGYSCKTLFKTLTTSRCDCCDSFGYYLYLVSCKRVCYMCFKYGTKHFPVSGNYISTATGLRRKKLNQVPHILGLTGRWAPAGERRVKLYDIQMALELVGKDTSQPRPEQNLTRVRQRFLALISAPCLDASGHEADWGHWCTTCNIASCFFSQVY